MSKEMKLTVPEGKTVIEAAASELFYQMVKTLTLNATCIIEYDDGTEIDITIGIHLK